MRKQRNLHWANAIEAYYTQKKKRFRVVVKATSHFFGEGVNKPECIAEEMLKGERARTQKWVKSD